MRRILPVTAILIALTFVAGCSVVSTGVTPHPSPTRAAASNRSATGALISALASCGLFPDDDGVELGDKVALALASQPHGEPTDVDAVTARCTLTALGLPAKEGELFDTTAATGGYQTLQWGRWSASLRVKDTLHFEVDVFAVPS